LPMKVRAMRELTESGRTRYATVEPLQPQRD
jgi:hypothetical protein